MNNPHFVTQFILSALTFILTTCVAFAQPSQTFVSAKNGVDGNPCTLALPCRSLASAHSIVAPGGRILIVDSGDYAEVTITKSVSIEAAPGVAAVVRNPAIPTLMTINTSSGDKIFLRGLHFKGSSSTNLRSILYSSGAIVSVSNCSIEGFSSEGIRAQASGHLTITQTTIRNNGTGVVVSPAASGPLNVTLESSLIEKSNFNGINASGAPNAVLRLTLRDMNLAHNVGAGLRAIASTTNSFVECVVENSVSFGNGMGLNAEREGAVIRVSSSTIVGNGLGLQTANLGQIYSRGNNTLEGNTNNGAFSELYVTQ